MMPGRGPGLNDEVDSDFGAYYRDCLRHPVPFQTVIETVYDQRTVRGEAFLSAFGRGRAAQRERYRNLACDVANRQVSYDPEVAPLLFNPPAHKGEVRILLDFKEIC